MFKKRVTTHYSTKHRTHEKDNVNGQWFVKHGTTSEWVGVVIGVLVAMFTIALFYQTQEATRAATKSAATADNTYREQRFNDSIMRSRDSIKSRNDSISQVFSDSVNTINERKRFELQSKSMEAQIKSVDAQIRLMRETQRQFEVLNKPYLQIGNFVIKNLGINNIPNYNIR